MDELRSTDTVAAGEMDADTAENWETTLFEVVLMTGVAGFIDAIGYAVMGRLYLSFMSGNSTQFGMAIAALNTSVVIWSGSVIVMFVLGSFAGVLLYNSVQKRGFKLVVSVEILCLLLAYVFLDVAPERLALLPLPLAMGMQNAIHKDFAGAAAGKSYITGALFGVGDALARALLGSGRYAESAGYALSWVAFVAGVVLGALSLAAFGLSASLLIAVAALATLILIAIRCGA